MNLLELRPGPDEDITQPALWEVSLAEVALFTVYSHQKKVLIFTVIEVNACRRQL